MYSTLECPFVCWGNFCGQYEKAKSSTVTYSRYAHSVIVLFLNVPYRICLGVDVCVFACMYDCPPDMILLYCVSYFCCGFL